MSRKSVIFVYQIKDMENIINLPIFEIPQETYNGFFGMVTVSNKTYVCPGWYEVPLGTTREQIKLVGAKAEVKTPERVKPIQKTFKVEGSKPGTFYDVKLFNGFWSCNCPSSKFHRGECKHIKKIKETEK